MREESLPIKAAAPVKKAYVKPAVTKHAAASVIVGSCGSGIAYNYYF